MSAKNVVHEALECCGSIGEPKRHDTPFEGAVTGPEGCFPFITFSYVYEMISMSEIKFGVEGDNGLSWISCLSHGN